jgi:hypothetical protein
MPPLWLHSYFHPKGLGKMMKLPLLFWSQSYKPSKEIVISSVAWFSSSKSLFSSRVIPSDSLARVNLFDEKTFGKQFVKSFLRGWRAGNWFRSGGGKFSVLPLSSTKCRLIHSTLTRILLFGCAGMILAGSGVGGALPNAPWISVSRNLTHPTILTYPVLCNNHDIEQSKYCHPLVISR